MTTFKVVGTKGSLSAPTIVMTGAGPMARSELERLAVERGFVIGKAVTKKTSLLICASLDSCSSKCKKAAAYGVEVKTYGDWI